MNKHARVALIAERRRALRLGFQRRQRSRVSRSALEDAVAVDRRGDKGLRLERVVKTDRNDIGQRLGCPEDENTRVPHQSCDRPDERNSTTARHAHTIAMCASLSWRRDVDTARQGAAPRARRGANRRVNRCGAPPRGRNPDHKRSGNAGRLAPGDHRLHPQGGPSDPRTCRPSGHYVVCSASLEAPSRALGRQFHLGPGSETASPTRFVRGSVEASSRRETATRLEADRYLGTGTLRSCASDLP